jgi:hypothetical protein
VLVDGGLQRNILAAAAVNRPDGVVVNASAGTDMTYEKTIRIEKLKVYYSGLRDGIKMYAHWRDGLEYVGTTGKSLQSAMKELNDEEESRIQILLRETA